MAYTAYECMSLDEILARVKKADPSGEGCDLIARAYRFADEAHHGQNIKSGEP